MSRKFPLLLIAFLAAPVIVLVILYSRVLGFLATDGSFDHAGTYAAAFAILWLAAGICAAIVYGLVRRPRETLLSLCVAILMGTAGEVIARRIRPALVYAPFQGICSPDVHHISPPNAAMYQGRYENREIVVRTNEDGLRTSYNRRGFLRQRTRVVVIGDSYVFGQKLPEQDAIPARLQQTLRRSHGGSVAVLNAGIISASPLTERALMRKIIKEYRPTHVIQCIDITDIGDDVRYERDLRPDGDGFAFPRGDPRAGHRIPSLWLNLASRCLTPVWSTLRRLGLEPRRAAPAMPMYNYYDLHVQIGDTVETSRFFVLRHPLDSTRHYFGRTFARIQDMQRECQSSGARFMVVVMPRYFHWNPAECPENWEVRRVKEYTGNETYRDAYLEYFARKSTDSPFPVVPLTPALAGAKVFPLCFRDDPHLNAAGNRVAAQAIAAIADSLGWFSGK